MSKLRSSFSVFIKEKLPFSFATSGWKPTGQAPPFGRMIVKLLHAISSIEVVSVSEKLSYIIALAIRISCFLSFALNVVRSDRLIRVIGGASRLSELLRTAMLLGFVTETSSLHHEALWIEPQSASARSEERRVGKECRYRWSTE